MISGSSISSVEPRLDSVLIRPIEWMPIWSPDTTRIAFASNRNGPMDLYITPVGGLEDGRIVLASPNRKVPTDWSPDGRLLVFQQESSGKQNGLYALALGSEPKPLVLVDSEFDEIQGAVSPDGRWLAYASNETGFYEIYVRPSHPVHRVLQKHSRFHQRRHQPQWRREGRELFYLSRSAHLVAVPINPRGTEFTAGRPKELFALGGRSRGAADALLRYAVSRDGTRFLSQKHPPMCHRRR